MAQNSQPEERKVLVLQGGGALGAYQAGAFEALTDARHYPDWLAGISIGAINAAVIAGNSPDRCLSKLRGFWDGLTSGLTAEPWDRGAVSRQIFNETAAAMVITGGVPGFFCPNFSMSAFFGSDGSRVPSVYDTSPLLKTLEEAVDVRSGNFAYFDSESIRIGPEHIMASGALPPGFPAVKIDGRDYWDGGLVSNTPLQYVLENAGDTALCIFQIDLFSARGATPANLADVAQREKDIRYSSRTRLTTDRFRQMQAVSAAAGRLFNKLPPDLKNDPDMEFLRGVGTNFPVTLVHLIHRKEGFEGNSKDYEFSRFSMKEHWATGKADVEKSLNHKKWKERELQPGEIQVFDFGQDKG